MDNNEDVEEIFHTSESNNSSDEIVSVSDETNDKIISDSESDNNDENNDNRNRFFGNDNRNRPLYRNAEITVGFSMLLILALLLHHNLTMECISDIILVLQMHCLSQDSVKNNLYKFKKFFDIRDNEIIKHYYCSSCTRLLESVEDNCPDCVEQKKSFFVQLPLIKQLRDMYLRVGFYESLQTRFQRTIQNVISDVYDGILYSEWVNNGFLADIRNISFSLYTDGVPVFKSTKISMWPVYLTINEMPFKDRKKRENTLLLGYWYGNKKPLMNSFILKFRD